MGEISAQNANAALSNVAPNDVAAAIFGCASIELSPDERDFFRAAKPWGFILFARNIGDPDEIRRLVGDMREAAGWAAPVLIDQEGGRVARLRGPIWRDWPPVGDWCAAADSGDLGEDALLEALRLRYRLTGLELASLGVDVDCAPLLDLRLPGYHEIMGDRALGATPESVGRRAEAIAQGLRDAGALPVIKHLPGHGRATVDSHHELPVVDEPREVLSRTDFSAFKALNQEGLGMTAHVVFTALDAERPATLSPIVIEEIVRGEIGFDGLLMSDDVGMRALSGSETEKARLCLAAGVDLVLHCSGVFEEMKAAFEGVEALGAAGRSRSDRALAGRGQVKPCDEEALEARLSELVGWRRERGAAQSMSGAGV